jgi:hypothetical protein
MNKAKTTRLALFIMASLLVMALSGSNLVAADVAPISIRHLRAVNDSPTDATIDMAIVDATGDFDPSNSFSAPYERVFVITSIAVTNTNPGYNTTPSNVTLRLRYTGSVNLSGTILELNPSRDQTCVYNFPPGFVIAPHNIPVIQCNAYNSVDVFGYFDKVLGNK